MNFFYLYADNIGSDSGFKLPRYVSLKSNEVNTNDEINNIMYIYIKLR